MRPLSFLSEVEDQIRRLNPGAISGPTSRAVDFRQGLARLELGTEGDTVLVQCFELADGRDCLKAIVHWAGSNEDEEQIQKDHKVTIRCIPFGDEFAEEGTCFYTGKPSSRRVFFAKSY